MHLLQLRHGVPTPAARGESALRKLIALELNAEQRGAVDADYDRCFAILGAPGTGKSTALKQRIARVRVLHPNAQPLTVDAHNGLDAYAVDLLAAQGVAATLVDDVEAELHFAECCAPLFGLEWAEFAQNQLDPEVPGLRSPERFLASAFRLIRRLRDAAVTPAGFLARALAGATEFYAKPPNFADPAMLAATKAKYHDSLDVRPRELAHQRLREIDLAKILTRLYEGYVELARSSGQMTGRDGALSAAELVRNDSALASRLRERHRFAFVDEAQDLTSAQLSLLAAIFGDDLSGVTLCGDPKSAISTVRVTNPDVTFGRASARVELKREYRTAQVAVQRTRTSNEEAEFVAQRVAEWLGEGIAPEQIAVIFRSVRCIELYENALLDRDIPCVVAGDTNVFEDRRARDALALLWNVYDPFRHEWLLRTLVNPALGLNDASLAILCSEPVDPQRRLFAFDDEPAPTARVSRWDPKRDLRLGWNVIRGERDDALSAEAAARVQRFRRLREGWLDAMDAESFEAFARRVWRDGLARDGTPGSARARAQQVVLQRLLARLNEFLALNPDATIAEILQYAEERAASDLEQCETRDDRGFVQMLSVEAARGREFEHVVVANVRPGAFPLWYVPDAFLFSPRLGMIPKENVGEAHAQRTAKFSYYMFNSKSMQHYNERERRAFRYALRRARRSALVTASGTPTRGVTAPELLEELR